MFHGNIPFQTQNPFRAMILQDKCLEVLYEKLINENKKQNIYLLRGQFRAVPYWLRSSNEPKRAINKNEILITASTFSMVIDQGAN